jgi:hypothetical protein
MAMNFMRDVNSSKCYTYKDLAPLAREYLWVYQQIEPNYQQNRGFSGLKLAQTLIKSIFVLLLKGKKMNI